MASKRNTREVPELRVVFDTNAIFTGSSSDLLRREVVELIESHSGHHDVKITWHLPRVVVWERRHQMLRKSLGLLNSVGRLERILDRDLGITEESLRAGIQGSIDGQLKAHSLQVIQLDPSRVDWEGVIHASTSRLPPFDPGEKEKGFRDAVVMESFIQLQTDSPCSPNSCRVVLVTQDALLTEAVSARLAPLGNVRLVSDLEELKGLISTLIAEVDEKFVADLLPRATKRFLDGALRESVFYKEDVRGRIEAEFASQLCELPKAGERRVNGKWYIHDPRFVEKKRQRVTLASKLVVEAVAYHRPLTTLYFLGEMLKIYRDSTRSSSPDDAETSGSSQITAPHDQTAAPSVPPEAILTTGRSSFEVVWSLTVATNGNLSRPRIEGLRFMGTDWDNVT